MEHTLVTGDAWHSEEFARIFGLVAGQEASRNLMLELTHPEDRDLVQQAWKGLDERLGFADFGIRRIFAEMAAAGLAEPQYRQRSESVELILRAVARIPSEVVARLPKRSLETLQFLEQAEQGLGTGEIADALQQSRPTTLRQLRALQEQGLVSWSGNSQRDPRASWAASR